ncbi:hypothetical protein [Leptolyngbya ohadii]|uniref:hypothetical protein n=1 Tax=Leptolyngbya ohadii TaxID=1962290 RepID=UPI00117B417A|nr:hypothetical protein [Leptolyngbya ohadii]
MNPVIVLLSRSVATHLVVLVAHHQLKKLDRGKRPPKEQIQERTDRQLHQIYDRLLVLLPLPIVLIPLEPLEPIMEPISLLIGLVQFQCGNRPLVQEITFGDRPQLPPSRVLLSPVVAVSPAPSVVQLHH